jgi:hypothetical protein
VPLSLYFHEDPALMIVCSAERRPAAGSSSRSVRAAGRIFRYGIRADFGLSRVMSGVRSTDE